jgi:hypothetical protein
MSSFETQVWQRPRVRRADLCLYGRRLRCRRLLWHPVYRQIVGVRGVCSVFKKPILFKVTEPSSRKKLSCNLRCNKVQQEVQQDADEIRQQT